MARRTELLSEVLARKALWVLGSAVALLSWFFAELSEEVLERNGDSSTLGELDRAVLRAVATIREPWLNPIAVDLTALGSPTVLGLLTTITIAALLALGRRRDARYLLASSLGAAALTTVLKRVLERPRPSEIPRLVEVASHSYPSGHSLASAAILTTVAILIWQCVPNPRFRAGVVFVTAMLVFAIGASRVYLGVHYPTDVAAGISVGVAWAFALELVALRPRRNGANSP